MRYRPCLQLARCASSLVACSAAWIISRSLWCICVLRLPKAGNLALGDSTIKDEVTSRPIRFLPVTSRLRSQTHAHIIWVALPSSYSWLKITRQGEEAIERKERKGFIYPSTWTRQIPRHTPRQQSTWLGTARSVTLPSQAVWTAGTRFRTPSLFVTGLFASLPTYRPSAPWVYP